MAVLLHLSEAVAAWRCSATTVGRLCLGALRTAYWQWHLRTGFVARR
jgi:hypothetical protein